MFEIVTILILDYACLSYASSSRPTLKKALNKACSQYIASCTHNEVIRQFTTHPQEYPILDFTEFVLQHRLA
jgi:hypothetical protein